jgi:hypothetical protein
MSDISINEASTPPSDTYRHALTVSQFLQAVSGVTAEAPLVVAVRDHQHFNRLLADYAVVHVTVDRGPAAPVVILDVEHIS